jgi:predicted transcriptional regulator
MEHVCMQNIVKEAVAIAAAQASVRVMDDAEISAMIASLASTIQALASANIHEKPADATRSQQDKKVRCMECGKTFKSLSGRHLGTHGMTMKEYHAKHSANNDDAGAARPH